MLPLRWNARSLENLEAIIQYIAKRDVQAAANLHKDSKKPFCRYRLTPISIGPAESRGTRELVAHPNYIIVYRVLADCIEIANVLHARQKYP